MREIKETASVGDSPTLQALAMLAKFYPTVKVVAHDGELGTLDGLENIAQSKLFAHILTLQKLILEIRSLAGLKFRDGKNLLEEVSAKCAETDRLREALEKYQWVSVEVRMPEPSKVVLCCNMKRPHEAPWVDYTGMFADGIQWCSDQATMFPTHWMELPLAASGRDDKESS